MFKSLICAIRGHCFGPDIKEVDQFGNDWLVHDCERCGRIEVLKRPPPVDVIVHGTITTEVIRREHPEAGRRQSDPLGG